MRKLVPLMAFPILLVLIAAACTSSAVPTSSPDSIASAIAGTMAAITPVPTDTTVPTPISFPTFLASPFPSAVPSALPTLPAVIPTVIVPGATRIVFQNGATSAVVSDSIAAGDTQNYVLQAMQGQPMLVSVDSPNGDVTLSIKTQGGTSMLSAAAGQRNWQGNLPASEDYYLSVHGASSTEHYNLNIVIPWRITFLEGADSAKLTAKTVGGFNISYAAFAAKGQKMTVDLTPLTGDAALSIFGFADGQPFVNANMHQTTNFSFTLPATQDYIIQVVPRAGSVVSYQITVKIQ